jgi:hypothetical protein
MATAKVTYFMEDPEGYGSSESFYCTTDGSLTDVLPKAQTLFKTRMALCGEGMSGTYLRISNDAIQGDALVDTTTYVTEAGAGGAPAVGGNQKNPSIIKPSVAGSPPALPNLVLTVRFQVGTLYHAIKYFHGLPVAVLTTPPGPSFVGDFQSAWANFLALFPAVGGFWQIKSRTKDGANQKTPVGSINTAGGATTIVATGHTVGQGQVFRLGGFRDMPGIRGTYTATSVVAGSSITVDNQQPIATVTIPNKGYVQLQGFSYPTITSAQADEQAFRKAGRPFGLRPGRRPAPAA